jgi:hypothetical protein
VDVGASKAGAGKDSVGTSRLQAVVRVTIVHFALQAPPALHDAVSVVIVQELSEGESDWLSVAVGTSNEDAVCMVCPCPDVDEDVDEDDDVDVDMSGSSGVQFLSSSGSFVSVDSSNISSVIGNCIQPGSGMPAAWKVAIASYGSSAIHVHESPSEVVIEVVVVGTTLQPTVCSHVVV